jgi:hypothetical protein
MPTVALAKVGAKPEASAKAEALAKDDRAIRSFSEGWCNQNSTFSVRCWAFSHLKVGFPAFTSPSEMIVCLNPFMKNLLAFLAIIGLSSFFAGCTTTGPAYKSVKDTFPPPAADAGRIFIYRDAVYNPSKMPAILLNGEQVGLSKAQGFFYIDRPAGEYKVELFGEGGPPASFTLSPGQTLYVRIGLHSNASLTINHQYPEVVDDTIALRELVSCKYTGGAQQ